MQANQQHVPQNLIPRVDAWVRPLQTMKYEEKSRLDRLQALEDHAIHQDVLIGRLIRENTQLFADTAPIGALMDMVKRMIEDIERLEARIRLLESTP
jgi:hypothetical protein